MSLYNGVSNGCLYRVGFLKHVNESVRLVPELHYCMHYLLEVFLLTSVFSVNYLHKCVPDIFSTFLGSLTQNQTFVVYLGYGMWELCP